METIHNAREEVAGLEIDLRKRIEGIEREYGVEIDAVRLERVKITDGGNQLVNIDIEVLL